MFQFYIMDGEAFAKNPVGELQQIEKFLNVKPYFEERHFYYNSSKNYYCYDDSTYSECLRPKKGHWHPPIEPQLRKKLLYFFEPYNEQFFKMIDRRYSWDN